jgi:hypothetical protein
MLLPQFQLVCQASGFFMPIRGSAFAKAALVDESYGAFAGYVMRRLQAAFVLTQAAEQRHKMQRLSRMGTLPCKRFA